MIKFQVSSLFYCLRSPEGQEKHIAIKFSTMKKIRKKYNKSEMNIYADDVWMENLII